MRACGVAVLAAAVLAAGGLVACGDDGSTAEHLGAAPVLGEGLPPEVDHPARAAIDRLQRAFLADDYRRLCGEITSKAALEAGKAAHGDPTTCQRDLRRLFRLIREGGGWRDAGAPRVTKVEADGDKATVTVALDRRWQARVPLALEGGRWRLSGFFGTSPSRARQVVASFRETEFPSPGRGRVAVSRAGKPCPEMSESVDGISGGCRLTVKSRVAPLTILTPLGYFEFARCSVGYDLRVDATGRTWTDELVVNGGRESEACGDVNACYDPATERELPWRGRIHADGDGGFVHRIAMCMYTCVGLFIEELELRLTPDGEVWRLEPVDGGGDSGLRFQNALQAVGDVDIDVAG